MARTHFAQLRQIFHILLNTRSRMHSSVYIYTVSRKKVSPLKILQYHEENFTELNISLLKDSHMYFKQWCEVSAKYTLAFVRNQTLNKAGQKFN